MRWKASLGRNLTESAVGLAVTVLVLMVDSYHGFMGHDGSEVSPLYKIRTYSNYMDNLTYLLARFEHL